MTEEFNLSEKRREIFKRFYQTEMMPSTLQYEIEQQDKEFIKRLKEELNNEVKIAENMKVINQHEIIDNLAGEDLK